MMKNTRLYTFAVLFDRQVTPKRNLVYMKSRDKLATSDVKLSSRIIIIIIISSSSIINGYFYDIGPAEGHSFTEGHSFKTLRFFQVIRLCSHRFTFILMTWKISSSFSTVTARILLLLLLLLYRHLY